MLAILLTFIVVTLYLSIGFFIALIWIEIFNSRFFLIKLLFAFYLWPILILIINCSNIYNFIYDALEDKVKGKWK